MENNLENMLRDAWTDEPPQVRDVRILAAIRASAPSPWATALRWAAAASIVLMLGGSLWRYGQQREIALKEEREIALQEEGELMLEIIGMANIDDFSGITTALL